MTAILSRILQTEHGILVVIRKRFCVTGPTNDGAQSLIGRLFAHEILEFVDETAFPRRMRCAFIQYPTDMRRKRHVGQQMTQEDALALVNGGMCECHPI